MISCCFSCNANNYKSSSNNIFSISTFEIPKVFFKKMTSLTSNGLVYTIFIERNVNKSNRSNSDSALFLLFESPIKNEPYEFDGIISKNGDIVFNCKQYFNEGFLDITISGAFINDTTFSLNLSNWKELNVKKLVFTETNKDYILYPINYHKSVEEYFSICDYTPYIDINSYIFKEKFPLEIVKRIEERFIYADLETIDDYVNQYDIPETEEIDFRVIHFDKGFLTLRRIYSSIACGAVIYSYSLDYINFDIYNKIEIELLDIFSRNHLSEIQNICKNKFKIKYKELISNMEVQELQKFYLPETYAILKNGILFQFRPDEMGFPRAAGHMSIFISYSEVIDLLEKNETVLRLLEKSSVR
jgi:hypothetical protein